MKEKYSIIIPIFNEEQHIKDLLSGLKSYHEKNHEIIIINDGSNDGSLELLKDYNYIKLLSFYKNRGKGIAIKEGLKRAINENIVIFDGDLELNPAQLELLMILNKDNDVRSVFANRYSEKTQYHSFWDFGNYFISKLFNIIHKSNVKDPFCCAKSFYKNDIIINNLSSSKFDIDVELTIKLLRVNNNNHNNSINVEIDYRRRNRNEGKKLKLIDTLIILKRIIIT